MGGKVKKYRAKLAPGAVKVQTETRWRQINYRAKRVAVAGADLPLGKTYAVKARSLKVRSPPNTYVRNSLRIHHTGKLWMLYCGDDYKARALGHPPAFFQSPPVWRLGSPSPTPEGA